MRHAVLSYQHLGLTIPNSGNVATFIRSLYDADTHLFANRVGETGDLKSTALAFQTLEYLGELQVCFKIIFSKTIFLFSLFFLARLGSRYD